MNTQKKSAVFPPLGRKYSRPGRSAGIRLRFVVGFIVVTLVSTAGAFAYGQIQRQVDPHSGTITYFYRPAPANGKPKAVPVSVSRQTAGERQSQKAVPARRKAETAPTPSEGIILTSYSDFPRVSEETQKARDMERRRILKHELAWEQAALDEAIANKDAGDILRRHRENIESLHREISNVR